MRVHPFTNVHNFTPNNNLNTLITKLLQLLLLLLFNYTTLRRRRRKNTVLWPHHFHVASYMRITFASLTLFLSGYVVVFGVKTVLTGGSLVKKFIDLFRFSFFYVLLSIRQVCVVSSSVKVSVYCSYEVKKFYSKVKENHFHIRKKKKKKENMIII